MAAPTTLACWIQQSEDGQRYWIYEAAGGTESMQCFIATTADEQRWKIFQQLGGGTGGGPVEAITAPTSPTDSSMFPGGVFPATGTYVALDENFIYTFEGGTDTQWQQTPRSEA